MTIRLMEIRTELEDMARKEGIKLFRLARRAKAKGVSEATVNAIRNEGYNLYTNYASSYPERLLDWKAKYDFKYAFCGERMKHTYVTINEDGDVIKVERR